MSELTFAPLASFADVTMGHSPVADLCNTDDKGLPFLQGCAGLGARKPQTAVFCNPPLRTAKAGSVLISVRAPVGTMNYADQDYCIGRGLGSFKAKSDVSNTIVLNHAGSGFVTQIGQGLPVGERRLEPGCDFVLFANAGVSHQFYASASVCRQCCQHAFQKKADGMILQISRYKAHPQAAVRC